MNTETLKAEHFNSLKELSEMAIKISEAKETLIRLENTKTQYLKIRKEQTITAVNEALAQSEELIKKIQSNNNEVHTLYKTVSSFKGFLDEMYAGFQQLLADFEQNKELFDAKVEAQTHAFSKIEADLKAEEKSIKAQKKELEASFEHLERDKIKLADERETIKRTVERLKNNQK